MGQNWIIDVLADLRAFAQANDLPLLAGQLDVAAGVAVAEIMQMTEGTPVTVHGDSAGSRGVSGAGRTC